MKKWGTAIILALLLIITGCGNSSEEPVMHSDGFEKAEYEKFNSYASENGLGGTLIYVEGRIVEKENVGDDLALILQQDDGNKWLVGVPKTKEIEEINGKSLRIYGEYLGYSDVYDLPALMVSAEESEGIEKARIDVYSNIGFSTVWKYSDVLDEYNSNISKEEVFDSEKNYDEQQNIEAPNVIGNDETEINITLGMENALKQAERYLDLTGFSYQGIIEQLEYEKYTHEEAVYAADNCGADWKEEAVKKAKEYLNLTSFSRQGLIDQLKYDKFTDQEAEYAVEKIGY